MSAAVMTVGVAVYSAPTASVERDSGPGGSDSQMVAVQNLLRYLPFELSDSSGMKFVLAHTDAPTAIGLFLIGVNLLLDGVMSNGQEHLYAKYRLPPFVMMAALNFCSACCIMTGMVISIFVHGFHESALVHVCQFLARHNEAIPHVIAFGVCAGLTQLFVYICIFQHGSFFTTAVTISRKFLSILLSVFLFNHELHSHQWFGVVAVFTGLSLQAMFSHKRHEHPTPLSIPDENSAQTLEPLHSGGRSARRRKAAGLASPVTTSADRIEAFELPEPAVSIRPVASTAEATGTSDSSSSEEDAFISGPASRRKVSVSCLVGSPASVYTEPQDALIESSWQALVE
jgi:hypothetical protein